MAFDAHHIKVGNIPETPCELDRLIEEYAALCDDAAQHTDAKVAYEIIPFDLNVNTLDPASGWSGRRRAERRVGDRHLAHGQAADPTAELNRIPREYLAWVELSDGPVEYMDDPIDEVINYRKLPGEGEFDIPGYIEACQASGITGRGESKSSPRSCATSRSRRSSSARTRRRSRSFAPA